MTAAVNHAMVRPLKAESAEVGTETWIGLSDIRGLVPGQKIDFAGTTGLTVAKADGTLQPLAGTYLVASTDEARKRVKLMDVVDRKAFASAGTFDGVHTRAVTYKLVGPQYFNFFAFLMAGVGLLFVFVAMFYREKTHLRDEP
jgi:POT family proton-dependent oligopeptide transporter